MLLSSSSITYDLPTLFRKSAGALMNRNWYRQRILQSLPIRIQNIATHSMYNLVLRPKRKIILILMLIRIYLIPQSIPYRNLSQISPRDIMIGKLFLLHRNKTYGINFICYYVRLNTIYNIFTESEG